jgi:flagellin-like protein
MNKKIQKKGVSPVITSIVLVAVVVGMITIIFFWLRSTMVEGVVKLDKNVDIVCQQDVKFNTEYDFTTGDIALVNSGNSPIFDIKIKVYSQGNYRTVKMSEIMGSEWGLGLTVGKSVSYNIASNLGYSLENIEKLQLIPMLVGKNSAKDKKVVECKEEYSQTINKE